MGKDSNMLYPSVNLGTVPGNLLFTLRRYFHLLKYFFLIPFIWEEASWYLTSELETELKGRALISYMWDPGFDLQ